MFSVDLVQKRKSYKTWALDWVMTRKGGPRLQRIVSIFNQGKEKLKW